MQKARRQGTSPLRLLVGTRFQVLFHSPSWSTFHLSLTGTGSLSVTREYLALEGGPPGFPQGFPCPVVLGIAARELTAISPTGLSPSVVELSRSLRLWRQLVTLRQVCAPATRRPTTPSVQRAHAITYRRFGLFPVRSPLLGESRLLSLPGAT